jgi:23S rRNA (cytidine1920-2'-O)/16S rRNA (cytidine1409-2'-O)-methyltransferase
MSDDFFVLPPPELGDANGAFASRAGEKLEAALRTFPVDVAGKTCADLGANVGGFTDCLLKRGAAKVYAVDTAYGVLAWTLRKDSRVVVRDRCNALHVKLPEPVAVVAVDVGWTRQDKILPHVAAMLAEGGQVLSLIKPHYESEEARIQRGVLSASQSESVLRAVVERIAAAGWRVAGVMRSPLAGQKGNIEYVAWLQGNK